MTNVPALKLLQAYIGKLPHLELVASCEDAMQALKEFDQQTIDLLFLGYTDARFNWPGIT